MPCSIQRIENITIVTLESADLGKHNAKGLKSVIAREVDFALPVIVDFGAVEYFDCSGLSLIVYWLAEGNRAAGKVVICSASPQFRALIEMVRIASSATVYSSVAEAIRACRETGTLANHAGRSAGQNAILAQKRQTAVSNA